MRGAECSPGWVKWGGSRCDSAPPSARRAAVLCHEGGEVHYTGCMHPSFLLMGIVLPTENAPGFSVGNTNKLEGTITKLNIPR
jgi:hypothetical protein